MSKKGLASSALSQVIQLWVHFKLVLSALSQNVFAYNCERSLNLPMNTSTFCWSDRHTKWSNTFFTVMSITVSTTLKPVSVSHTKNTYETHRSHDRDLALIGIVIWVLKRKQHNKIVTVRQLTLSWCWCCAKEKLKESERQKENIIMCSVTVNNIISTTSVLSLNEHNHNKQQKFTLMSTMQWWPHDISALWRHQKTCT